MTVQCIACQHFSMRNAGKMAELGYGHCELVNTPASFESAMFERHCPKFEAAAQDVAQRRTDWLTAKKQQFLKGILGHD